MAKVSYYSHVHKTVIVYVVHLLGEISMETLTNELGHKYLESRGLTRAEKE